MRVLTLSLILALPAAAGWADSLPLKGLSCVPSPTTLCLNGNRFSVTVDWEDAAMVSGQGQVAPVGGDDWGLMYYDDSRYLELLIKVLDGCSLTNHYWVFAAGVSDYEQTITVTDTMTGVPKIYSNTLGNYDVVITDTGAIPCGLRTSRGEPVAAAPDRGTVTAPPPTMKLAEDRFEVDVEWRNPMSATGFATPVEVTSNSGYFWFFNSTNPEMIVKVVDGSTENGFFHVFAAATTNVEYTIRVVDRCTAAEKTYFNPLNTTAPPVADETAFPVGGGNCIVFEDGFESGDTMAWTSSN